MPNWVANHLTIHGENASRVLRSLLKENKETEDGYDLDFNKIIPMPESLQIESGSRTNSCVEMYLTSINPFVRYYGENKVSADEYLKIVQAVQESKLYGSFNDKLPIDEIRKRETETYTRSEQNELRTLTKEEILEYGKKAVDNVLTHGAMDWYGWSCENWGTKWNACNTQIPDPETAEVYFETAWSPVPQVMLALSEQHFECAFEYEYAEEQSGNFAGHCVYEAGDIIVDESFDSDSKECYEMFFKLWGLRGRV